MWLCAALVLVDGALLETNVGVFNPSSPFISASNAAAHDDEPYIDTNDGRSKIVVSA